MSDEASRVWAEDMSAAYDEYLVPAVFQPYAGYCRGTPLRAEIESRGDLEATTRAVATTLARRFGPGPVVGRMAALVVSAGLVPEPG